jgi:type I restriction-modification system DNA methylase subunit
MADRTHREFTNEGMQRIVDTYHNWRKKYEDIKGFCVFVL